MMEMELKNPYCDKNFSIQFFNVSEEDRRKVKRYFFEAAERYRHIFLQGDCDDWMMIEFWTDDIDLIIVICDFFEESLGIKIEGL